MLVFNATNETHQVVAYGNHFTIKPKQVKNFQDHIGDFLTTNKAELGLVRLPEAFEEPEYKASPEGQAEFSKIEQEGIGKYVQRLKQIVYNNQVSLKKDLDMASIKADPRAFASDGEIDAMEKLASYMDASKNAEAAKIQKIKELEQRIGKLEK